MDEYRLDDFNYDALVEVLKFFYCGKVEFPREKAIEVKAVASLFHLDGVEKLCSRIIERPKKFEGNYYLFITD